MIENLIHHMDNQKGISQIEPKSVNLIISDPPYFEVKGEFDFVWKSFDEYLEFMEGQAKLYKRVLADNGTLFVWGHAKRIAYVQVIFDKYFTLENSLVWWVHDRQTNKGVENYRVFAPVTERLLMYSTGKEPNEWDKTGWEMVKADISNFQPLRNYFEGLQKWIGTPKKTIIDAIGQSADHCFRWGSTQWDLPTKETYSQLIEIFNIKTWDGFREYEDLRREYEDLRREYEDLRREYEDLRREYEDLRREYEDLRREYEDLRREYEDLRREYEDLRRPFNNYLKLTDVLKFSQGSHITKQYDHETVKPEKLTRALILTCSRKNDLVLVPFAGSGTECAMAAKEGRRFIGFDTKLKYVEMANNRVRTHFNTPQLALYD